MKSWKALLAVALVVTGMSAWVPAHAGPRPGRLGPGWVLAQYVSAAPEGGHGPVALYLISPAGARYRVASWPDSRTAPQLIAWSRDGSRALLQVFSPHAGAEQLTLATGAVTTFTLPGQPTPVGYTPDGASIVASQVAGSEQSLARYSLTGKLLGRLGPSVDGQVVYAPGGTAFATGDQHGVRLVSVSGTVLRRLTVPGTAADTCGPARWWNARTILVSCAQPDSASSRLWLVPVSGARPSALTPPRPPGSQDLGDLDAWQLGSGLYLQAAGPCGVVFIVRQTPGGIRTVTVPHTTGNDNRVLTALGGRLLVQAATSCTGTDSLLWFNPATRSEQWLIRAPGTISGVSVAISFYTTQNVSS